MTRCGDFAPFGRFLETLGGVFLNFYLLLGPFGAKFLFGGSNFGAKLFYEVALVSKTLGAFSFKTLGHSGPLKSFSAAAVKTNFFNCFIFSEAKKFRKKNSVSIFPFFLSRPGFQTQPELIVA